MFTTIVILHVLFVQVHSSSLLFQILERVPLMGVLDMQEFFYDDKYVRIPIIAYIRCVATLYPASKSGRICFVVEDIFPDDLIVNIGFLQATLH